MSIFSTIAVFHHLKGPKKQYETAWQIIWTPMTTLSLDRHGIHKTTLTYVFFYLHHVLLTMYFSVSWVQWVPSFGFGVRNAFCVQRAYSWNFRWRDHCRKGLEICISNKPVKSPLQIAEGVFESFGPILLLVEALEWWSSFPRCRSQSCKTSLGLLQQCRAHNETRISFFVE